MKDVSVTHANGITDSPPFAVVRLSETSSYGIQSEITKAGTSTERSVRYEATTTETDAVVRIDSTAQEQVTRNVMPNEKKEVSIFGRFRGQL
jgi:hypothetical protein